MRDYEWGWLCAIAAVVAVLVVLLVVIVNVRVDGAGTHHLREVKVAACKTLDDQSARATCIEHA